MPPIIFTIALGTMLASVIFTPLAFILHSDRGVRTGAIAYLVASLTLQELLSRTRRLNPSSLPDETDCQS